MNIKKLIPLILILGVLVGLVVVRKNTEKKPSLITQANLETLAQDALEAKEVSRLVLFAGPTRMKKWFSSGKMIRGRLLANSVRRQRRKWWKTTWMICWL